MRALARAIHAATPATWSIDDAMAFADALIGDRYLEVKSVGIEVVARYRRDFTPGCCLRWKRWLADEPLGQLGDDRRDLRLADRTAARRSIRSSARGCACWARDRNMWVRRASAVGLIPSRPAGLGARPGATVIARRLHADQEDLIQKAVGWMLREAGKTDPAAPRALPARERRDDSANDAALRDRTVSGARSAESCWT